MVFSSLIFLYLFLPIILILYYLFPKVAKNTLLVFASLFFYAWGEPKLVVLMLFSIVLNYIMGIVIERSESNKKRKTAVAAAITLNLAILGYYKYAGFFIEIIENSFNIGIEWQTVPLPIGISFYTFQAMSYIIDVYRKEVGAQKNFINLALYISLFPQLVAGPIVRYQTIVEQIKFRIISSDKLVQGTTRFIQGLGKKVLIANPMAEIADDVFAISGGDLTTGTAWLGILAYTLQIYFDFSGYSDMAIGLGKCFGFEFEENFRYPYMSQSVSEFWRRWHISLGSWFRDYVYIPLGGNRVPEWKIYRNLFIVWTLTGFWHGASWTFMAWGFYYGLIISIERAFLLKWLEKIPRVFRHIYLMLIVIIGWVFFRADNFSFAFNYIRTMFHIEHVPWADYTTTLLVADYYLFIIIGIILVFPVYGKLRSHLQSWTVERPVLQGTVSLFSTIYYLVLVLVITMYLVNATHNPFIYFRF